MIHKNIPNIITLSRLALTAAFEFLLVTASYRNNVHLYLALFLAIISSDIADGYLARKMQLVSDFGAKFDVAVDFIYVTGVTCALIHNGKVQEWFLAVLVINFIVFLITSKQISKHGNHQASVVFDKLGKAVACLVMLLPALLIIEDMMDVGWVLHAGALIITVLFCISAIYRVTLAIGGPAALTRAKPVGSGHSPILASKKWVE